MQDRLRSKVKEAVHRLHHEHDAAEANAKKAEHAVEHLHNITPVRSRQELPEKLRSSALGGKFGENKDKKDLHPLSEKGDVHNQPGPTGEPSHSPSRANPAALYAKLVAREETGISSKPSTLAQDSTPLHVEVEGEKIAIDTQIQLYATNAQLNHPWVSPALGYLGGLPPLLIIAGDNEVLRDEIIYA
jgi:hypothetical protein